MGKTNQGGGRPGHALAQEHTHVVVHRGLPVRSARGTGLRVRSEVELRH